MDDDRLLTAEMVRSASDISVADWLACAASGGNRPANPFIDQGFFRAMEESGAATPTAGWQAQHLVVRDAHGTVAGIMPCYLKSHSQGEYVFDHGWADAFERAGGNYYPKLQVSVPFTPVTAPKLLVRDRHDDQARNALLSAAARIAAGNSISSIHATFLPESEQALAVGQGWLARSDRQFHWQNRGYGSYDDFLGTLASRKRKALRRERREALADGIEIDWISGQDITEAHWDRFHDFYMDTGSRKWGRPYLNRSSFSVLGELLGDRVVLVLARRESEYIAGALNLVGDDAIYGRYWGCTEDVPFLHFEVCYHQAIDYAIAHGLKTVEAGAQGEHKLARGYEPTVTHSAHWIGHEGLRRAIRDYLEGETEHVDREVAALSDYTPFRRGEKS